MQQVGRSGLLAFMVDAAGVCVACVGCLCGIIHKAASKRIVLVDRRHQQLRLKVGRSGSAESDGCSKICKRDTLVLKVANQASCFAQ